MAPWTKVTVNTDDIYTDLAIKKIENEATGPKGELINDYTAMFLGSNKDDKTKLNLSEKILVTADPGGGKTTLSKKISFDWGRGVFRTFTIVFLIMLKFARPGDSLEIIIIQQTPALEGIGVTTLQLNSVLTKYGRKCLIILDGFDELRGNNSILRLIKGQDHLNVNVLLTSRPHVSCYVERYFYSKFNIKGFTLEQTEQYIMKLTDNDLEKTANVYLFYLANFIRISNCYASPLLLQFN